MDILVIWIALSFGVAFMGGLRRIGFIPSLLASLFLSPLIGFIIVLTSKTTSEYLKEQQLLKQQQSVLNQVQKTSSIQLASELEKLTKLKEQGTISEEDFNQAKAKLLQ